jgi:N-acetylated-alpha-linked acidic dipeptidase
LSETAKRYARELQDLRDQRAKLLSERTRQIDDSVFAIVSDPRNPTTAPAASAPPPQFNFAPLLNALDSLSVAASAYEKSYMGWRDRPPVMQAGSAARANPTALREINNQLVQAERALLASDGLKHRSWFRHLLYAPGLYTGYGVKTMPGPREAIEQGEWSDVDREISRVAAAVEREAVLVRDAASRLDRAR